LKSEFHQNVTRLHLIDDFCIIRIEAFAPLPSGILVDCKYSLLLAPKTDKIKDYDCLILWWWQHYKIIASKYRITSIAPVRIFVSRFPNKLPWLQYVGVDFPHFGLRELISFLSGMKHCIFIIHCRVYSILLNNNLWLL